jgi:bifunctional enzyme CysN/CysC
VTDPPSRPVSANVVWHPGAVARAERWRATRLGGATVWFTGLSGSGKSTVATAVERRLLAAGRATYLLDGDNLRHGLNGDLGFTASDRSENVRRVGEVARLFADAGLVALVPLISPFRADRDQARSVHAEAGLPFIEVFVDTPLEECERRDPKGLYAKARAGELRGFTGIDDPYEPPTGAELVLSPDDGAPDAQAVSVLAVVDRLVDQSRTSGL